MDRRKFVNKSGLAMAGAVLPLYRMASSGWDGEGGSGQLRARDVNSHLRSLCEVDEPSVDRIIVGDPDTIVRKIGTAWMPYWETCREAVSQGVNVLVVHEPTFYTHLDLDAKNTDFLYAPDPGRRSYLDMREKKKSWIEDNGLVIIRCHDVWDKIPGTGIPYALGNALGFMEEDLLRSDTYYNVYRTPDTPAIEVAKMIASKMKPVGQPGVAFYGDEDYKVRSVGVGTGCICNPLNFMHLEPDLFVSIDDSISTWVQTAYAEDSGRPLVVINHGTSEEFGIRLLHEHLKKTFPEHYPVHFSQGCTYRWVTG